MNNFVHLHNHSFNSYLDGFGKPEDYIQTAKEQGYKAIALTDHGNVDGAIKWQNLCKAHDIQPIFGCEFYMVPDISIKEKGEKRSHVVVFAQNEEGWQNILKMVTISNIDGFYYRPRISPDILLKHLKGTIITTACVASFLNTDWRKMLTVKLFDSFSDNCYLEAMPHLFKEQGELNKLCLEINKVNHIPIIATNDCHYVHEKDAKYQEVLLAVQTKKNWNDKDRFKFNGNSYWMKTQKEMALGFRQQGILDNSQYMQAFKNTLEIAEKCQGFREIPKQKVELPKPPKYQDRDDIELLKSICQTGFFTKIEMKGKDEKKYKKRLELELDLIIKHGFVRYFLIVWDLILWCKQQNIMVGPGRGSSSGSLVCYLMGITQIDPIEYDLLFARFISPDRIDLPDIDMDFEDTKRDLVKQYLKEQYGKWNVAGVSTFSIMKGKSALRDVSRVFDVPLSEVNRGCSAIISKLKGDEGYEDTIGDAFRTTDEGRRFAKRYPEVAEISINMEGMIRQKGQHAAAVIISGEDLRIGNKCAFSLGKDKEPIVNWDKEDIEWAGLMKLDILGLNMLSVFNKTKELIKKYHDKEIKFEEIELDNKLCFEEFSRGNNVGCFQFGSDGIRKFCQELGIDNFGTLVHANALFRPGTLHSNMADLFIRRKRGHIDVPTQHPIIEDITKNTYGIILYQEQMMRLVHELAGFDWKVAEKIRKVVAKSKGSAAIMEFQDKFVRGCLKKETIGENEAVQLWNTLASFGEYSFNKSHAVAYSTISYWCMWLKINYPVEYICALLTYGSNDKDRKNEYIDEAFRLGLDLRPPKIGISLSKEWRVYNEKLYAPFIEIKGVGDKTADAFSRINKEGFFQKKDKERAVSSKFMKILDELNAYEDCRCPDDRVDIISNLLGINLRNTYKNVRKRRRNWD